MQKERFRYEKSKSISATDANGFHQGDDLSGFEIIHALPKAKVV
jgi:hypothetical protein